MLQSSHPTGPWRERALLILCCWLAIACHRTVAQDPRALATPGRVLMEVFGTAPTPDAALLGATDQLLAARRAAVAAAVEVLLRSPEVPPGPAGHALDELLRAAVRRPPRIAIADESIGDPEFAGDRLTPADVRRLLLHGFAEEALGPTPGVRRLTDAVRRAGEPVEVNRDDPRCAVDAWGRVRWSDAPGTRWLVPAPEPRVTRRVRGALPDAERRWLAITLAAPTSTPSLDDLRSVRLLAPDGTTLLECASGRLSVADPQACAPHPPHLAVASPAGELLGLVTAHGTLPAPPRARAGAAGWLELAAQVLPDPAHLDLIAQYLIAYAPDPPDPRHPAIPGTPDWQGDVRDRPAETLATVRGGVCRADCDDLAGLLVELLRRQGRPAFQFGPPGHVMAMTAELDRDSATLTLLHTGAPQIERGAALREVVGRAVRRLDELLPYDPDQVPVWVRSDADPWPSPAWVDHRALASHAAAVDAERLEIELARGALQAASRRLGPEVEDEDPSRLGRRAWIHAEHCRPARALETQDRAIARQQHPVSRFWSRLRSLGFAARAGASAAELEVRLDQLFVEREGLRDRLTPLQYDNLALSIASWSMERDRPELAAAAALRGAMPLLRGKVDPATRRLQDAAAATLAQALREQPVAAGAVSGPHGAALRAALDDWARRFANQDPERLARDARLLGLLHRAHQGAPALRTACFPALQPRDPLPESVPESVPPLDPAVRAALRGQPSFWLAELRTLLRAAAAADELAGARQAVEAAQASAAASSAVSSAVSSAALAAEFLLTALTTADLEPGRELLLELIERADGLEPAVSDLLTDLAVRGLPSTQLADLAVTYARAGAEPTTLLVLLRTWRCRARDDAARAAARALQAIESSLPVAFPADLAPEFAGLAGPR